MCHELGFVVDAHEFPAKALLALKAEKPDLLITDLNMPEMTGFQLSEEVRKLYNSAQLPILMITTQSDIMAQSSSGSTTSVDSAIQKAGIDLVLNKPFEATDLQNAIHSLLKR
jgi:CheY-like chemotaxis protein